MILMGMTQRSAGGGIKKQQMRRIQTQMARHPKMSPIFSTHLDQMILMICLMDSLTRGMVIRRTWVLQSNPIYPRTSKPTATKELEPTLLLPRSQV